MRRILEERLADFRGKHLVLLLLALVSLWFFTAAQALSVGLLVGVLLKHPYAGKLKPIIQKLLACAIVGLGFGMKLTNVAAVGGAGFFYTLVGLTFAILFGLILGKVLQTSREMSTLLSVGTAICGGSAIAAVAPIIRARHHEIAVSLAIVFSLNALALLVFPVLGERFSLSESQFGLWCAIAIHDTSSVLGATMQYGAKALEVGTTVKLVRALWIIPVAIIFSLSVRHDESERTKLKLPWFVIGFLLASALSTLFPAMTMFASGIEMISRRIMVLTLFLIGASLTKESLKQIGFAPLAQGMVLWIAVAVLSLVAIKNGFIVAN